MPAVPDEVYRMLIDCLHVTYEPDAPTEARLRNEAAAGIAYIRKYCDPAAECSPGTRFGQLLCDYVLRAESGALETFAQDFAGEIIAARVEAEADGYAEAMGYA